MGISTSIKIFIFPDESGLLLLRTNGLYTSDPDGSNETYVQAGNYFGSYYYDEATGFIYFIDATAGNVWRNTTTLDFTAFTDLGNFFPAFALPRGYVIKGNNERIIFGGMNYINYTDNLFSSSTDVSIGEGNNMHSMTYEGGNNALVVTYDGGAGTYKLFRSTDNGLTWPQQTLPDPLASYGIAYKI